METDKKYSLKNYTNKSNMPAGDVIMEHSYTSASQSYPD